MLAFNFSISPQNLWHLIATPRAPQIVDVRRRDIYSQVPGLIPGSVWREPTALAGWIGTLDRARPIVVTCKLGKELSQVIVSELRSQGYDAAQLAGGQGAWTDAGLPLVDRAAADRLMPQPPSLWVTRRHPKIDRIACPWLIRRFIDPEAVFLFVSPAEVAEVADIFAAEPFDIEGVHWSHRGELCTFDVMLEEFGRIAVAADIVAVGCRMMGAHGAIELLQVATGAEGLFTLGLQDHHGHTGIGLPLQQLRRQQLDHLQRDGMQGLFGSEGGHADALAVGRCQFVEQDGICRNCGCVHGAPGCLARNPQCPRAAVLL